MTDSGNKMATFTDGNLVALRDIETRIAMHFHAAARNLVDVGRCLNEAKDQGLVPHGQWEAWVEEHTGMRIQKAQRLMRMAREVPEDSAMARLSFSKVAQLLTLPDPVQREELAQRAEDDNMTVRELQARIAEMKRQDDAKQHEIEKLTKAVDNRNEMVDKLQESRAEIQARCGELEGRINELIKCQAEVIDEEVAHHVEEMTSELMHELEETREYAAAQAEARQRAEQETLNAMMGQASSGAARRFCADDLDAAVRSFIGEAGVMPHMGAELAAMRESERADMRRCLDRVQDWVNAARAALGTVVVSVND